MSFLLLFVTSFWPLTWIELAIVWRPNDCLPSRTEMSQYLIFPHLYRTSWYLHHPLKILPKFSFEMSNVIYGSLGLICICAICNHMSSTRVCSNVHGGNSNPMKEEDLPSLLQQHRRLWKVSIFRNNCQGRAARLASSPCNWPAILYGEEWGIF